MAPGFLEKRLSRFVERRSSCVSSQPTNTVTDRLNAVFASNKTGQVLSLCPNQQYYITEPIAFTAPNQEISTQGYPTDNSRATLVVSGAIVNLTGHTVAVEGSCLNCNGVKLRNVQINGTRLGGLPVAGGANIEMGGPNANQLIEYVHSYDPRGWSCLHVSEGYDNCTGAVVQYNEIGPAGAAEWDQWADGISVACMNSQVKGNLVNNPTDGGIVLFGSPGTRVENNTIWAQTQPLLGGINLVDVVPFGGDFNGVVVTNNTIAGGFATTPNNGSSRYGENPNDVLIKIGIAIGPRVWFGGKYNNNVSTGGTVINNEITGALTYGIAMASATNFTVENNFLHTNYSFIGTKGPNCSTSVAPPTPFLFDLTNVNTSSVQGAFANNSASYLVCMVPPPVSDAIWPFGGDPTATDGTPPVPPPEPNVARPAAHGIRESGGDIAGIVVGTLGGVAVVAAAAYVIRRWAIRRAVRNQKLRPM
ncbi:hypothetical protein CONPUDRAFT_139719 [Coniophora puteana RWD-64-598 SS2]|uniref:Right handed beta helix domain-containing protein n=1 Tax=Coniophora puteana (strain RWD-64-598) TaxID=741705 RepID=A0A5M3MBD5_CONPW|nr:uncharacterized protein CONPUDRAFT_139719 [Coniophora puteana RWD-64-598 SS2]EIW76326.1 hypothetical protein CONPUDRAFT_139719 [Coniophora puteana RWD-64-598 SS2]